MLNINFLLNLVLFALFEFNSNCLAAEIVESSKQSNSSKVGLVGDAKPRSIADQSNKHVLDFEWDLQTAAGHKKGTIVLSNPLGFIGYCCFSACGSIVLIVSFPPT